MVFYTRPLPRHGKTRNTSSVMRKHRTTSETLYQISEQCEDPRKQRRRFSEIGGNSGDMSSKYDTIESIDILRAFSGGSLVKNLSCSVRDTD